MHFYNTEAVPSGDCHSLLGDVSESAGDLPQLERQSLHSITLLMLYQYFIILYNAETKC